MIEVRLTPTILKEKKMALIVPFLFAFVGILCIIGVIFIAGAILVIVTGKIEKKTDLPEVVKASRKKKVITITVIAAGIIAIIMALLVAVTFFDILNAIGNIH